MIFPHEFYEVRSHLYMPDLTEERLHMGNIVELLIDHPKERIEKFLDRNTVHLLSIEQRGRAPKFSKDVVAELKYHYDYPVTSHLYVGYEEESLSFSRIHRDRMDVIIVQQYGSISVSIWKANVDKDVVGEDEASLIEMRTLKPGDAVYIPKGTYHWIQPLTQRVTYSFGIENG